ncbi:MAG: hypothetical protein HY211_05180 [Candidatus Omnitrophica bacterium]|nr:hypothetical protein [Candidatus Omnitrophota bacterium]
MTPEERLFKVVEAGAAAERLSLSEGQTEGLPNLTRLSGWAQLLRRFFGVQPIRRVNGILLVLLICLALYFVLDLVFVPQRLQVEMKEPAGRAAVFEEEKVASPPVMLEEYLSTVSKRDAFRPAGSPAAASGTAAAAAVSPAEGLRLVGIAWSDQPEAMIVDNKVSQTFFLKAGQKIRSLMVQKITRESVTLQSETGESVELQ